MNIPGILITPVLLQFRYQPINVTNPGLHYPPLAWRLIQYLYELTFSAIVRHHMGDLVWCSHFTVYNIGIK